MAEAGSPRHSPGMTRGLVLVDHGSRHDAANAVVESIAALVAARSDHGTIVRHAHMELARPTLDEAIDACVAAGADDLVIVPYFLGPGRHASRDIPALVARAQVRHPAISMRTAEPLGVHERLAELVLERSR